VVSKFGHLPKRNEEITFDDLRVKVLRADSRRLHSMLIEKVIQQDLLDELTR
jgi:magnesium and cobalt transporter